jgi:major inositol transporter-like SP family MFS transporter
VVHQRDDLVPVPRAELGTGFDRNLALFVAVNIGSWLFVHKFVPETKGTTLEELEDRFEAQGLERAAAAA